MKKNDGLFSKDFDNIKIFNIVLYLVIIVMPFVFVPKVRQPLVLGKVIFLYLVGILLLLLIVFQKKRLAIKIEEKILMIFIGSIIIATIFSIDIETAIMGKYGRYEGLIMFFIYIILFICAANYSKVNSKVVDIISVVSCIMSIYSIFQFYHIDFLQQIIFSTNHYLGVYGTIGNSNFLATYLLLCLILTLSIYILHGIKRYYFYSSILFCGLLVTVAMSCYVGFFFTSMAALAFLYKNKTYMKRVVIILITFSLLFIYFNSYSDNFLLNQNLEVIEDIKTSNPNMGSGRIKIWKITMDSIKKRAIIGTGMDTLGERLLTSNVDEYMEFLKDSGVNIDKAHNEFLEYWACGGLLTLISYIALIGIILTKLFKRREDDRCKIYFLMILGYVIQSFFNISVPGVAPLYWILLGAAVKHYRELAKGKEVQAITD